MGWRWLNCQLCRDLRFWAAFGGQDSAPYGHTPIEKSICLCALRAGRLLFVALIRFEACQRLVKLRVLTLVRLKLFCNLDPNQVGLDTIGKTMQT
jgi:hypothetical protein